MYEFEMSVSASEKQLGPALAALADIGVTWRILEVRPNLNSSNGATKVPVPRGKTTSSKPLTEILREFVENTPSGAEITSDALRAAAKTGGGNPTNIFSVLPALIKGKLIKKVEPGVYKKL